MSVALYMDHHVHSGITRALRQRGVDVITSYEDGTAEWDDPDLLARAKELGRTFFTQDDDFLAEARRWAGAGREFAGVVYAAQLKISVGQAVKDLELIAKALDPKDMANLVMFLPIRG
ncbi:MAG: DUF5615 family PIN-like protein [Planctomycetes bacterium]|nr:DUF5615 family PIN-like protein [Planctomycetota bacterium]